MQQEEENLRSELLSSNITPEKSQRTLRGDGSERRDITSQNIRCRIHYTPQNSPDKFAKTLQSSGSFRKDEKLKLESNKRKVQSSHNESPEKIQKTCPSGKFVNTLIGQWSKHIGVHTPISQITGIQESPMAEEMKRMYTIEERKIQKLQKKLQAAEETISSLSASHEAELRAKEEILQQLNGDWESITKYYYEISESLKGFQQHKDNLSALYNNVIVAQQSTVKKLQQELSTIKLNDEEYKNTIMTAENKIINQEKRIQEMTIIETELKKQLENMKKSILEKEHLNRVHIEENLELIKKQENLTSMNQELQAQLKNITEEKQNLANIFTEKDKEVSKLQEEFITCKNKMEDLICQNTELIAKYEKSSDKERELSNQLQSKIQEINKLRENLSERQEIESSLVKDLNIIDNDYKKMQNDFVHVENELKEARACNSKLERSLQDIKMSNEQKIMELNRKIEFVEKEKEQMILNKNLKIQELEKDRVLLKEKHEIEVISLKKELDIKLEEMKKKIDLENVAFVQLKETFNKMKDANENKQKNIQHHRTKESRDKDTLKERVQPVAKSNLIELTNEIEHYMQMSQVCETKEQQSQNQKSVGMPNITSRDKSEISNLEQDIYNFNTTKIYNELENILSPTKQDKKNRFNLKSPVKVSEYTEKYSYLSQREDATRLSSQREEKQEKKNGDENNLIPKKKIFKTRGSGLRQYGTPRKLEYGKPGKISKK
ncbi:hypothetical protein ANTPLA_LOCUS6242 [Anthophora plagiata]